MALAARPGTNPSEGRGALFIPNISHGIEKLSHDRSISGHRAAPRGDQGFKASHVERCGEML